MEIGTEILTLHCDTFGKTKFFFYYYMFSASQPKPHSFSEYTISNKSCFCGILLSTLWTSLSRKLSPLLLSAPGQCKPHPPALRTQHPLVGLYLHSSCGMLIKDHLLEYHLVIMMDNEQELTISTKYMANEHQPSKEVPWNLKPAWFIHLPKVPTTAALHSSAYIQIFTCSLATLHSNMGNDT